MKGGVIDLNNYTVLVVDDDKEIRDGIEIYLKNEGITVIKAKDGIEAIEKLNEQEIHLIILDIMMPRLDGISTTFKIREAKNIPIIILSAKSEDTDKILGLQIGADDYMTKPFNPIELIARIKAQLRRYVKLGTYQGSDKIIDLNGLTLEQTAKKVTVNGEDIKLTPIILIELFIIQMSLSREI